MKATKFTTVEAYIDDVPETVQHILKQLRAIVQEIAPDAVESIAYDMPAYKLGGKALVYFAAFSRHIGVYALPDSHAAFAGELSAYKQGKGSVQFPLDGPMPYDLFRRMVEYRASFVMLKR